MREVPASQRSSAPSRTRRAGCSKPRTLTAARASPPQGDDSLLKLLTHVHTRTEEELEKRTPPGLALLHRLTRTTDPALRGRILRHYLVPQGTVRLPDGKQESRPAARASRRAPTRAL